MISDWYRTIPDRVLRPILSVLEIQFIRLTEAIQINNNKMKTKFYLYLQFIRSCNQLHLKSEELNKD